MSAEPSISASASSAAAATTSSSVSCGPRITNHILTLPHPQFSHFLTQAVHLQSESGGNSLFVHCTSISSTTARSLLPTQANNTTASDQDEAIDAELQAALIAAGRSNPTTNPTSTPIGSLASDFALAMYTPQPTSTSSSSSSSTSYKKEPISTPITTTTTSSATSSLATTMSKRIALKLQLPQLYLSLDLPPGLLPVPGRIQSPEDSRALLALEKALRDACASAITL